MTFFLSCLFFSFVGLTQTANERPNFEVANVRIAQKTLKVEVADTYKKRSYGLMFKKSWGNVEGMIFIFPNEAKRSFWMKNTFLPLSVGFFNTEGVLKEIKHLKPLNSILQKKIDSVQSKEDSKYVLEVPKGWFVDNNVAIGAKLQLL